MADVFHEVDEQLRSARAQLLLRRGWPFAAGVPVVAAIAAVGAWALNQNELAQSGAASEQYAGAMQLLAKGDLQGADGRFAVVARTGPRAYRALADMQMAGLAEKRNNMAGAITLLDQAAQAAPSPIMSDAAKLQAAYVSMDIKPYADTRARLLPLAAQGRPYRTMAREALGMSELATGRLPEARGDLQIVSLSSDATEASRNRASAALALLQSGAWTSIAPLAKQSAGLKARPSPPPPIPGQAPAQGAPAGADQAQATPQSGTAQ